MTIAALLLSSVAGFALGWAASGYRVSHRQAAARELLAELGRPTDFVFCQSSNAWEAV